MINEIEVNVYEERTTGERKWSIEDPTPEDLKMPDCSSVEPESVEGYDPETDEDNSVDGDESA